MLLQKVNADASLREMLAAEASTYRWSTPVMATPAVPAATVAYIDGFNVVYVAIPTVEGAYFVITGSGGPGTA